MTSTHCRVLHKMKLLKSPYLLMKLEARGVAPVVLELIQVVEQSELMELVDYSALEITDVVQNQLLHCSSQAVTTVITHHCIIFNIIHTTTSPGVDQRG